MTLLERTTELYASVLRQLLPIGGYDASPNTEALAVDIYAHAKLFAQADLDAKRLLNVLEGFPSELISEYEAEYGLPLKCSINAGRTLAERIEILKWIRQHRNVMNREYLEQILAIFGVVLLELKKYKPMQCTGTCVDPVNTEELRYKVRLVIPSDSPADLECIIDNYLPGYLRVDVLRTPLLFKTSKPYPLYLLESVETGYALTNVVQREVMNTTGLTEKVETQFAIIGAMQREANSSMTVSVEKVTTQFAMTAATTRDASVSLNVGAEKVQTTFALRAATQRVALISNTMQAEKVTTQFAMISAQITN